MLGPRRNLLALVLVVVLIAGAIVIAVKWSSSRQESARVAVPLALTSPAPTAAENRLKDLAGLDDDIGAVLVVSERGSEVSPALRRLLAQGRVGGVLLFASNFKIGRAHV